MSTKKDPLGSNFGYLSIKDLYSDRVLADRESEQVRTGQVRQRFDKGVRKVQI